MAPPIDKRVEDEVAALGGLNIESLRLSWRKRFGVAPPALRSGDLLRRCYAERLQVAAYGRDPDVERQLAKLLRNRARGAPVKAQPPVVSEGAVFLREYEGRTYRVEKRKEGYAWDGRIWDNLSQIAREITGVRWNGPRFFGLRAAKP